MWRAFVAPYWPPDVGGGLYRPLAIASYTLDWTVSGGAPWWFHDSVEGMLRFLERTAETAGIDKLAGFTDDTRAFCSIPARHDLARRVQANWLARLTSRHVIDASDARELARMLAYDLARKSYKLQS